MKQLKAILSRIIGFILALVAIYFVGPSVKSFYAHHQIIAILVPFSLIGLAIYFSTKSGDKTKEETKIDD